MVHLLHVQIICCFKHLESHLILILIGWLKALGLVLKLAPHYKYLNVLKYRRVKLAGDFHIARWGRTHKVLGFKTVLEPLSLVLLISDHRDPKYGIYTAVLIKRNLITRDQLYLLRNLLSIS